MTMRLSQTAVLERAERLASTLAAATTRVERNVLLAVVGDFMSDRRPDLHKLRRTLLLLAHGSGGQLKRGGSYADQVRAVVAELTKLIEAEVLDPEDYRSVFGWTARLLLVRGLPLAPPPVPGTSGQERGKGPREPNAKGSSRTTPRPALGAVGPKSLSSLEKLKRQLEEREKTEKS